MALLSLAVPAAAERLRIPVLMIGLAGASLFFGDAMIRSHLSAFRGRRAGRGYTRLRALHRADRQP